MGEYDKICNLDKKELLSPEFFGQLNKLADWKDTPGILFGLSILLQVSNNNLRDHNLQKALYGRWAGDRVLVIGDYFTGKIGEIDWSEDYHSTLTSSKNGWTDISEHIRNIMAGDFKIPFDYAKIDNRVDEVEDEPLSVIRSGGQAVNLPGITVFDSHLDWAQLLEAFKSENLAERFWAIRTAGYLKTPEYLPFLMQTAGDDGAYFRRGKEISLKSWSVRAINEIKSATINN